MRIPLCRDFVYVLLLARLLLPHQSVVSHAPSILETLSRHALKENGLQDSVDSVDAMNEFN